MKLELPFATQEGESVVEQNSRETLINMFAEVEVSGRRRLIRRQRPGLKSALTKAGEKRCIERHKGKHYAVIDDKLYRFDGTLTELGTLSTSTGRCTMIFNDNDEIMVSDGRNGHYYNGTALSSVTSPVNIGPLTYMSGFGVFPKPNAGQFYITPLNDFSTVDALDFATAEAYSDNLKRVFADHSELWLFGTISTEVWQLSGGSDFPFSRFTNAQIERGILAPFSVVADDNTVFWLGDDGVFYRAEGYRPQRISTHPVERAVEALSDSVKENADAFIYTVGGHKFYTIRFEDELTLQFNIATRFWNRARTFGNDDWQILGSAGRITDYYLTPAGIVELDTSLNTDEGGIMERGGISAPLYAGGNRITVNSFYLDCEVGRAGIGKDANVMLRVARDGETFGNERWRSLGATGDYTRRATWRNLGQGRSFMIEAMMTDDVPFAIVGADAEIQVSS